MPPERQTTERTGCWGRDSGESLTSFMVSLAGWVQETQGDRAFDALGGLYFAAGFDCSLPSSGLLRLFCHQLMSATSAANPAPPGSMYLNQLVGFSQKLSSTLCTMPATPSARTVTTFSVEGSSRCTLLLSSR